MRSKKIHINELRHRVFLCSQDDVINEDGNLILNRKVVTKMWAKIAEKKASTFSQQGATFNENRNTRTHEICIRYRHDLNISVFAWLYEERLKSSPRWFKILKVGQTEMGGTEYFKFECRLVERGDNLAAPIVEDEESEAQGVAVPLPEGVKL